MFKTTSNPNQIIISVHFLQNTWLQCEPCMIYSRDCFVYLYLIRWLLGQAAPQSASHRGTDREVEEGHLGEGRNPRVWDHNRGEQGHMTFLSSVRSI